VETNIASWPSVLKLFKFTFEKYGRIDIVAANAGIHGHERWLEDITGADGELVEPDFPAITVNLIGMLYSCRLSFSGVDCSIEIGSALLCEEYVC
jgi:NAD(P)-dependent dehydrogenase (short-subunit alcohol dehydrogenase family)